MIRFIILACALNVVGCVGSHFVIPEHAERVLVLRSGRHYCAAFQYRGYVVTAMHCVDDDDSPRLRRLGNPHETTAQVLAMGPQDIALLLPDETMVAGVEPFDRAPDVREADYVRSIGHPGRSYWVEKRGAFRGRHTFDDGRVMLVSDIDVRPGDSGGVLLDPYGRAMGVNVIRATKYDDDGERTVRMYSVPVDFVDELIDRYAFEVEPQCRPLEPGVDEFGDGACPPLPMYFAPPLELGADTAGLEKYLR